MAEAVLWTRIGQDIPDLVGGRVGTRGVGTAWPLHAQGHAVWLSWLTEERQGQKYLDTCQVKKQKCCRCKYLILGDFLWDRFTALYCIPSTLGLK